MLLSAKFNSLLFFLHRNVNPMGKSSENAASVSEPLAHLHDAMTALKENSVFPLQKNPFSTRSLEEKKKENKGAGT